MPADPAQLWHRANDLLALALDPSEESLHAELLEFFLGHFEAAGGVLLMPDGETFQACASKGLAPPADQGLPLPSLRVPQLVRTETFPWSRGRVAEAARRLWVEEHPLFFVYPLWTESALVGVVLLKGVEGAQEAAAKEAQQELGRFAARLLDAASRARRAAWDSRHDVYTREFFASRLEEEIGRAVRYRRRLSLLLLEYDRYHLLEELLGSERLEKIAGRIVSHLRSRLRKVDLIARFRRNAFAVLLPETGRMAATRIAERIAQDISATRFAVGAEEPIEVTPLLGVCSYPKDCPEGDGMLEVAEVMLQRARGIPRERVISSRKAGRGGGSESLEESARLDTLLLSREGRTLLALVNRMVLSGQMELCALLEHMLRAMAEITLADRGMIAVLDSQGLPCAPHTRWLINGKMGRDPFDYWEPAVRRVWETGEPVSASAARGAQRPRNVAGDVFCVPMRHEARVLAVLYLETDEARRRFQQEDRQFVQIALGYAAPVMKHALDEETRRKELEEVKEELAGTRRQLHERYSYSNIVGRSAPMRRIFEILDRVVNTPHPVLIHGENGTGKELVARAIHYNSSRKDRPFVAENCAALPANLLEAELFGHVRGAFTGAVADKKGLLEVADGGTLFLDEIGDMSPQLQTKLLRVLEEKRFRPIGGKEQVRVVDIRIVSATNRDLKELIRLGKFREDLYYRLNVVQVRIPPLRERKEDVPLLVDLFLDEIARESGTPKKKIAPDAIELLATYAWPGNVRELQNVLKNVCVLTDKPVLRRDSFSHLERFSPAKPKAASEEAAEQLEQSWAEFTELLRERERRFVLAALRKANFNKKRLAERLGITRPALYRVLERLGLHMSTPSGS